MLRQFISSQQGRIRDHLPEYITIDPELTIDENEERWWTHHWGLVRQDMRPAYPGVSDQVIDGPIHDLYRAHHHDRHDRSYRSQKSHNRSANYVFEDMYPEFDIAYALGYYYFAASHSRESGESILHHEERNELRRIIFGVS